MMESNIMKFCREMLYASYDFKYIGIRIDESINLAANVDDVVVKLNKQIRFI